jgi:hypothetical protein
MDRFRGPIRQAWVTGLMIGLVMLAGCSVYQPRLAPIGDNTSFKHNAHVQVTLTDGTQVKLRRAYAARGTLWGYTRQTVPPGSVHPVAQPLDPDGELVGWPISAVRLIETRQPSPARTVGLCLVTGTLATLGLLILSLATDPTW